MHLDGTIHTSFPLTSFYAAAKHAGDTIFEEFRDPTFNESFEEQPTLQERGRPNGTYSQELISAADFTEFPWATGEIIAPEQLVGEPVC